MKRGAFAVCVWGILAVPLLAQGVGCSVEALFVSPYVDQTIETRIIAAIEGAQCRVLVAMYSFTDDEIGQALVEAHQRSVKVYVLLDDGQDSDKQGREFPRLQAAGIPVGVEHLSGLLHHKFAVVDDVLVITGSYNWSDRADDQNFENAVFVTCAEIAESFATEFSYIANSLLNLGWDISTLGGGTGALPAPLGDCEECLTRINSATQANFDAVYGIGDVLSQRLVDAQPFSIFACSERLSIESALQDVSGIGDVKARDIVDHFCSGLFDGG